MQTRLLFLWIITGLFPAKGQQADTVQRTTGYSVKKLTGINTENTEFCPIINGTHFIFVSDREKDPMRYGESAWKKGKHLNLFSAAFVELKNDTVSFGKVEPFNEGPYDHYHEGPIAFHPSGKYAVITRVVFERKTNKPQLYLVKKEGRSWSKPERISFCGNNFSYGHACFSEDGKTMFFSSDQIGTLGKKDIFLSTFTDGTFGAPFNLGEQINSGNDEIFPFFKDGTLYFSSDQVGTLGGMDIFSSAFKNGRFSKPVNAGPGLNTSSDEFSFCLTQTGQNGFFASSREGNDDIYFFTITQLPKPGNSEPEYAEIDGKFSYSKLEEVVPAELSLQLLDETGNIVQTTSTNDKGRFRFSGLADGEDYSLKTIPLGNDLLLHIFNKGGDEVLVLMSDAKGSFVYKKLDPYNFAALGVLQLDEVDINGKQSGNISGQFIHERMPGEPVDGINVMLMDESGKVYATVKTDSKGNFTFSGLPGDQNFYLHSDSADDLTLLLYNSEGQVVAELKREGKGPFIFRRINSQFENGLTLMDHPDTELFPLPANILEGKFRFDKLSGDPRALHFVVMDEAGNVLQEATTDANGNFRLTGLKPGDAYIFGLDEKETGLTKNGMQLQMLSRYGEEIDLLNANEAGLYVFRPKEKVAVIKQDSTLIKENTRLTKEDPGLLPLVLDGKEMGKETVVLKESKTVPGTVAVYFDNDAAAPDAEAKTMLSTIAQQLKADSDLYVQLDAYTDPSYSESYNLQLSQRRMMGVRQYLLSLGIPRQRIKGYYHGETLLVNGCTDVHECPDRENRANRRCEVRLVRL